MLVLTFIYLTCQMTRASHPVFISNELIRTDLKREREGERESVMMTKVGGFPTIKIFGITWKLVKTKFWLKKIHMILDGCELYLHLIFPFWTEIDHPPTFILSSLAIASPCCCPQQMGMLMPSQEKIKGGGRSNLVIKGKKKSK